MDNSSVHQNNFLWDKENEWKEKGLEIYFTPRNGSWLNITEIELSILQQQCLKRRIGDAQTKEKELAAWQKQRNQECSQIHWRFTTEEARIKLAHLYPNPVPFNPTN